MHKTTTSMAKQMHDTHIVHIRVQVYNIDPVLEPHEHTGIFRRWNDTRVEGACEGLTCHRHCSKCNDKGKHPWWCCVP